MNYDSFILYCFNQGIDPDIVRHYKKYILEDRYAMFILSSKMPIQPIASLGHPELKEIDTVEKGIKAIKNLVNMSDLDTLNKTLTAYLIKTFYLLGADFNEI